MQISIVTQLLTYVSNILLSSVPQDINNQIRQIITDDGYPFEEYNLKTQDGYFLTIHRIPGGKGEKIDQSHRNKPIAYLVHALTQSSIDWVCVGRNVSLEEGGCEIRKCTRNASESLAVGVQIPASNSVHLSALIAMIRIVFTSLSFSLGIFDIVGHFGFTMFPFWVYMLTSIFEHRISTFLVFILIYSIFGIDENGADLEVVRREIVYIPGGISTKLITHYSFGVSNPGTFRQYDYGKSGNMGIYNSTYPPEYPLENVMVPIAIFQGLQDYLASPEDVEILVKKLPNVVCRKKFKELSHASFSWTRGVRKLVYEKIADLFINYGRNDTCCF
ncbi:lipase 3-like isoform X2 [Belonocnema kinseyi]|uniref:lipase 3-like isoform X2 n=1 Tax=Belonocnema kinseyi TaxID=2817044 RepID=UPI00143DEFC2|nr:lipase 3-like isoform X2 [Belonocnema kinseyi]